MTEQRRMTGPASEANAAESQGQAATDRPTPEPLKKIEEKLPQPVKQLAGEASHTVEEVAHRAEEVTEASRVVAARATVPVRASRRRARFFMGVALGALAGFAGLVVVLHGRHQNSVDLRITRFVQRQQAYHASLSWLMGLISQPGFSPWSWLIPGVTAGLLRWLNYRLESLFVLGTGVANLIVALIKIIIARPRPADPSITVHSRLKDYSFPSGHTIQYMAQFGYGAFLAFSLLRPGRLRRGALALCASLIALVGPSRIALGHHWASDVLASYLLGTSFLIGHIGLYRRFKDRQRPVARGTSMTMPVDAVANSRVATTTEARKHVGQP